MINSSQFLVSHPTGNSFVKALLAELHQKDLLACFFTTIGFGKGCSFVFSNLKQRRGYGIPDSKVSRLWHPELTRLFFKGSQTNKRRILDFVYYQLDSKVSKNITSYSPKIIHAYEDGAYLSFKKAKEIGIHCSYELPIAHWATTRRLMAEEVDRYPEWESTLESTKESEEKLFKKEEELRLADCITCPSKFVWQSIPPEIRTQKPCQIAPFGSPFYELSTSPAELKQKREFKILFVGSMSQRKGLADVFEAMRLLKKHPIRLSILGQPSMPMEFYRKKFSDFEYFPPCTNAKVRRIMKDHDALILPSIIEGRALVQQEALSCGLPIIVTPNAGGADLVDEGTTGYLIPIRSPEKIVEKILALFESKIPKQERAEACKSKASSYSWKSYANKIINFSLSIHNKIINVHK